MMSFIHTHTHGYTNIHTKARSHTYIRIPGIHTRDWHQICDEMGEMRPSDELLTHPTRECDTTNHVYVCLYACKNIFMYVTNDELLTHPTKRCNTAHHVYGCMHVCMYVCVCMYMTNDELLTQPTKECDTAHHVYGCMHACMHACVCM